MSLRYYEITEADHILCNPTSDAKLEYVAQAMRLQAGHTLLDFACGHGELLTRWADQYGIGGTGVDISTAFSASARQRAARRGVSDRVEIIEGDAAQFQSERRYDFVSCVGATWIGNGTVGTIDLMRPFLNGQPHNLLLVGEVFWKKEPPPEVLEAMGVKPGDWAVGLPALARVFDECGLDLIYLAISSEDDWDRYYAQKFTTAWHWLRQNPDDPDAPGLKPWIEETRRAYIDYEREYCGWGLFVLAPRPR